MISWSKDLWGLCELCTPSHTSRFLLELEPNQLLPQTPLKLKFASNLVVKPFTSDLNTLPDLESLNVMDYLFKPTERFTTWTCFLWKFLSFMDYPITICTFCLYSPATQRQNWGQSPLTLMTNPTSIQKHVRNYVQHIIGCEMSHKLGAFHTDPQFPKDATQPFWTRRLV